MAYPWLIYGVSVSGFLRQDKIANIIVLFAKGKLAVG